MKVILFGATGMVGQGVLRECLLDPAVERVLAIVRGPLETQHEKLEIFLHHDLFDLEPIANRLRGYDACFFCLGVSSAGMKEDAYTRTTYDLTLTAARVLAPANPNMTFIYVSGEGTDSTERGGLMWARIKGRTENALLREPFRAVYLFRPGFIQPLHGIVSKTRIYHLLYVILAPLYPVLKALSPSHVTTTEEVGRAMIRVAKHGSPDKILGNREIAKIALFGSN